MALTDPQFDLIAPAEWQEFFRLNCIEASGGRFNDFSPSSSLSVLGEAQALTIDQVLTLLNTLYPSIVAGVLEMLGFTRIQAQTASATARFQLDKVYAQNFPIPRGYRFGVGNTVFETLIDISIAGNRDSSDPANYQVCRVAARAIAPGSGGNQPAQQCQIIQAIPGVMAVFLDERSTGGADLESIEAFSDRVMAAVAGTVGRDGVMAPLIQGSEFEGAAKSILGPGSLAIALPEVGADRSTRSIAGMHIFVANPDGTAPTTAQLRSLSESLQPRAVLAQGRLFFSTLTISTVNIDASFSLRAGTSVDEIAPRINAALRSRFSIAKTATETSLKLYDAIYVLKGLDGVDDVIVRWALAGNPLEQARNLSLPALSSLSSKTAPAKLGTVLLTFEPSGVTRTFNS